MRPVLAVVLAGVAAGACAPQPGGPPPTHMAAAQQAPRQCFHSGAVTNYRASDDRYVDLTVGANRIFRVELFGACPDVDWSNRIGVRTRGGGSFICHGSDVELIVPRQGLRPDVCSARSVRELTQAEVAAMRAAR